MSSRVPPPVTLRALPAGACTGLPTGTRVQLKGPAGLTGTVMSYQRECGPGWLGLFPVRLDNAIWQTCVASDVTVLAPDAEAPATAVVEARGTQSPPALAGASCGGGRLQETS